MPILLIAETRDIKSPDRPSGQHAAVERRGGDSYNAAAQVPNVECPEHLLSNAEMIGFLILLVAASMGISLVGTLLVMRVAPRLGLVAHPGGRMIHQQPTPVGGGTAIFLGLWLPIWVSVAFCYYLRAAGGAPPTFASAWPIPENLKIQVMGVVDKAPQLAMIFLGGVIVFLLGLADDRWSLSPWMRLAIETGVALMLVLTGINVEFVIESRILRGLITVVWIVGLINAFNFLDNMDGLSAGVAAIIAVFFSVVAFQTVHYFVGGALCCLIGALVGFLIFNFPPASIFMGDCGSTTIGYSLAVLTVVFTFIEPDKPWSTVFPLVVPLMIFAVPLFDAITVTWIRIRSGRSPFRGDTNHFSHRLVALGMKPWQAVLTIYLVTATVALGVTVLYYASSVAILVIFAQTVAVFTIIGILETTGRRKNGA
jgi:UDP-GlcNAc:undecaprenyl-phosphate/decaprenyl-phosphate GlcNAc-1-phosphate transferase